MRKEYRPMLADVADHPFSSDQWLFEIKWDGIRAIAYLNRGLSLKSRNGNELTANFPELSELKELCRNAVLDGEIIVMVRGIADFQAVLERSKASTHIERENLSQKSPATYVIFDIIEKSGKALTELPLLERKKILRETVRDGKSALVSAFIEGDGEDYYRVAVGMGVEGIMAKRKDSPYEPGRRSPNWLKIKKLLSCDCVVFGFTRGQGVRERTFGALVLGVYDGRKPVYVGKVGTGFSRGGIEELTKAFEPLIVGGPTLQGVDDINVTWVKPKLVIEVAYQVVTREGKLRMPRFRDLRKDKPAIECTIDQLRPRKLNEYSSKRNFEASPEPRGKGRGGDKVTREGSAYVVQEHHARRLHYDLRLERSGVLKSWAVPKGMPEKIGDRRLAIAVEDHPLEYGSFEGEIPKGSYGAGTVTIWDKGTYRTVAWGEELIEFVINGQRLQGRFVLTRLKKAGENQWLLLRLRDKVA